MSLPVSSKFTAAQQADGNLPVSQVQLVLGNYMSSSAYGSTVASSGDVSTDYPAAGAIDGDRTEINVGPASGADNDIGKSSWRSSGVPDNGDVVTLTVTFPTARTLTRIKLYHLFGHGLKTYKLAYWNGTAFVQFAATSDVASGSDVSIATTHTLDVIDFTALSTTKIKLTVTATVVALDKANVVEIEAYRLLDITDRVKGIEVTRQRDYKLGNPMASVTKIECVNDDRFFSINHTPTTQQVSSGFVNSELLPGIGLIVSMGFNTKSGANETVSLFVGSMDRLTLTPRSRDAVIDARDGMKGLVNQIDSSKLKSGQDIATNIKYVLNRSNISNYEMSLDSTSINIDYFFSEDQDQLSTIRDLSQAAGDAIFFFDESGTAVFRFFSTSTILQHTYTSESDFEAGTLTCIATKDGTDSLKVPVLFQPNLVDGALSVDAVISGGRLRLTTFTGATWANDAGSVAPGNIVTTAPSTANSVAMPFVPIHDGTITALSFVARVPTTGLDGARCFIRIWADSSGAPGTVLDSVNAGAGDNTLKTYSGAFSRAVTAGTTYWIGVSHVTGSINGIGVGLSNTDPQNLMATTDGAGGPTWTLAENNAAGFAVISKRIAGSMTFVETTVSGGWISPTYDSFSGAVGTTAHLIGSGTYGAGCDATLYLEGSNDGTTWDVSYSQNQPNGTYTETISNRRYWRLRWALSSTNGSVNPAADAPQFYFVATGTWVSPTLDMGSNVIALGGIVSTQTLNAGTVAYYTRTSADGVTFDAWVAVSGSGQINSAVARYMQTRVDITLSGPLTATPSILDITVSWATGAGAPKYPIPPSSFTFSFDSMLLDVQQEIADNLGGDTAIINDVTVQAQPLILTGADADVVWQGTVGVPPTAISGSTPLTVSNGDVLTYPLVVAGGMDVSRMSGANPLAGAITFAGGATGSWVFSSIHPTRPVLVVTITHAGSITNLQVQGKRFSNASYLQAQTSKNAASIAKYGDRKLGITNQWIVSASVAASIASTIVANSKDPTSYIPSCIVRPVFNAQIGDRVTVADENLDLNADYAVVGLNQVFKAQGNGADVHTGATLLKIPAGS